MHFTSFTWQQNLGKNKYNQSLNAFKQLGYSGEKERQVLGMCSDEENLYSPSLIPF